MVISYKTLVQHHNQDIVIFSVKTRTFHHHKEPVHSSLEKGEGERFAVALTEASLADPCMCPDQEGAHRLGVWGQCSNHLSHPPGLIFKETENLDFRCNNPLCQCCQCTYMFLKPYEYSLYDVIYIVFNKWQN